MPWNQKPGIEIEKGAAETAKTIRASLDSADG
jgi:hypothetical protein